MSLFELSRTAKAAGFLTHSISGKLQGMELPRLPRFKRASTVAPIQLTARDQEIIELIHRYRFLRSSHVVALIGTSAQHLQRRLQLLYHHGYLTRPRAQLDYYHKGGSRPIIYGLGNKGATLFRNTGSVAYHNLDWNEKNSSTGRIFLEHALLVSDIMVQLELACRKHGQIRLLAEGQIPLPESTRLQRQPFRWKVKAGGGLSLSVIPDRVFALEFLTKAGKKEQAFFFLEADRGTMPVIRKNFSQTSFYRKLRAYEATWSQSLHRRRFGFNRFRVLTVTTSAARVKSLVDACSQLKRGHGLFLFADRTILEKPGDILSSLWLTGKKGETATLLN